MSDVKAVAKAVEETAKFGQQALQTSEKAGGFVAKVIKEPLEQCAGIVTDQLKFVRFKRLAAMEDEVDAILAARGVEDTRAVPPKLALPILDGASLETESELQSLWNELLANAMDPNFAGELRIAFADIVRQMSPLDARFVELIYDLARKQSAASVAKISRLAVERWLVCRELRIDQESYLVSVTNLIRLQCVAPHSYAVNFGQGLAMSPQRNLQMDVGTEVVTLTPLGVRLMEACAGNKPLVIQDSDFDGVSHSFSVDVHSDLRAVNL